MKLDKFGTPYYYPLFTYSPDEFKKNFVIYTNGYFSNLIKKEDFSIHCEKPTYYNMKYDSMELLLNSINFGKALYETFNGTFKVSFHTEKFHDVLISDETKIDFTKPTINKEQIIELFKTWFYNTGFPSENVISLNSSHGYISFQKIENLMCRYIILYLFASPLFEINNIISEGKNINNKRNLNKLNFFLKNLDLDIIKTKNDNDKYIKALYEKEENLLDGIQQYTDFFQPQISPYIILNKKNNLEIPPFECKTIDTSNNLFDLAWSVFIKVAITGESFKSLCICEDCGLFLKKLDSRIKLCDECKDTRALERSKKQRIERKALIDEIINCKKLNITDAVSISYINEIEDLTSYGHSKEKDTFSITTLKKYKKHILENLKNPAK